MLVGAYVGSAADRTQWSIHPVARIRHPKCLESSVLRTDDRAWPVCRLRRPAGLTCDKAEAQNAVPATQGRERVRGHAERQYRAELVPAAAADNANDALVRLIREGRQRALVRTPLHRHNTTQKRCHEHRMQPEWDWRVSIRRHMFHRRNSHEYQPNWPSSFFTSPKLNRVTKLRRDRRTPIQLPMEVSHRVSQFPDSDSQSIGHNRPN